MSQMDNKKANRWMNGILSFILSWYSIIFLLTVVLRTTYNIMHHINIGASSASSSFLDKRELSGENQFKWEAIKSFVYLAEAFASTNQNYTLFAGITDNVPLYLFFIFLVLFGMPYMFMDFFIKQYTGRIDFNQLLNPLLRAVSWGIICQSAFWTLIHANDLADSVLFFFSTLRPVPEWSECSKNMLENNQQECISTKNITILCQSLNKKLINLNLTSVHHNYRFLFISSDRSIFLTRRIFLIGLVWIFNFVFSTISDQMLVKLFNLSYLLRNVSTFVAALFVVASAGSHLTTALKDVLRFTQRTSVQMTAAHVLYVFGIGIVGVYDYGTLSPFVTVDNAVIAFAIVFTTSAFLRAVILRTLFLLIKDCVIISAPFNQKFITVHYVLFVILPLSADFLYAQRLFTIYLYINLIITLFAHLAAVTSTITRLLSTEFRMVKEVYVTGLLCFFGFLLTIPVGLFSIEHNAGYMFGLGNCMLVFGGLRAAIILYLYGIQKFSTDIHFWLGFKPTKYWIVTWSLIPVCLGCLLVRRVLGLPSQLILYHDMVITGFIWISVSLALVVFLEIRTIFKYLALNNLAGLFRSSVRYGPPDPEERKRRKKYDEALSLRHCTHNCVLLDDKFDCNHLPLTFKSKTGNVDSSGGSNASTVSILRIFEAGGSRKPRISELMDIQSLHD